MEFDITEFLRDECPRDYSASVAEIGANAGTYTWQAAMENSDPLRYMTSPERIDAFRAFVLDSGGWDETECDAFTVTELEALFIQWVSGVLREMFSDSFDNRVDFSALTDEQWIAAERLAAEGAVSSGIFRGDDGRVYFYCGS
jgi:hypothetical protein